MSVQPTTTKQQEEEEEDRGMTDADNDRDSRFRDILQQSFGKNGLTVIAIFAMVLVISVLLILAISFSYTSTIKNASLMSVVVERSSDKPQHIIQLSRAEPILTKE